MYGLNSPLYCMYEYSYITIRWNAKSLRGVGGRGKMGEGRAVTGLTGEVVCMYIHTRIQFCNDEGKKGRKKWDLVTVERIDWFHHESICRGGHKVGWVFTHPSPPHPPPTPR